MEGKSLWQPLLLLLLLAVGISGATHVPFIGVPKQIAFHYITSQRIGRESAPATLLTATESSVLAGVNPSTSQISWRHQLEGLKGFDAEEDRVCTWQDQRVSCFEAGTGYLIWDRALLQQEQSSTETFEGLRLRGQAVTAWTSSAVYSFTSTGEAQAPVHIVNTVGLLDNDIVISQNPSNHRLSSTFLADPSAATSELPSDQDASLLLGQAVVTLKKGSLTSICPDASNSKKIQTRSLKSSASYTSIQRLSADYLLALHSEGRADVVKLVEGCQLELINNFKDAAPSAVYSSNLDRAGDLQVSRLAYSENLHLGLLTIFSTTISKWGNKGYIQGSTLPLNQTLHGALTAHVTEVAPPENKDYPQTISRSVWITSSGHVASSFGGAQTPAWVREEGLSTLSSAVDPVWLDVSRERLSHAIPDASETVVGQVVRYLGLMKEYGLSLPTSLWWYIFGVEPLPIDSGLDPLTAQFGFKKLALVASTRGKVFALDLMTKGPPMDLGNTHIVWQAFLAGSRGEPIASEILWSQMSMKNDKVLLVGSKASQNYAWELDAQTGSILSRTIVGDDQAIAPFALSAASQSATSFKTETATPVYWVTHDERSVKGWRLAGETKAEQQWAFALPSDTDDTVYSVVSQQTGTVASLGRILGNRSTLYKYLNPHLFLLTTLSTSTQSASFYLIDAVSGNTVWYTTHTGEVDPHAGMAAALTENWLVYSFRDSKSDGKPTKIVSVELYEDWEPKQDPKRKKKKKPKFQGGKHLSSFDLREYPTYESRSFIAPFAIKSMSTSSSRLGVTTKSLLVNTDTNALVSIPRPLLDPRRPIGQASKTDMEERLVLYDPVIPLEPKWTVSEGAVVLTSSQPLISSTSTLLESTSLVLLAGLDLFCGRIAPSGTFDLLREDFNKVQLVLTIGGLALGVAVAKPLAERKKLRSKWYTQ